MKYLVMECGLSYAVVLDSEGRFLKVANLGYEVGQTVDSVVEFAPPKPALRVWKRIIPLAAAAACALVVTVAGGLLLTPYGTVRMQINPDVMMWVNRTSHVVRLEGLNEDGRQLIEGYSAFGKSMETVSDDLADRAIQQGYLKDGGSIALTVDSKHEEWKTATEEMLLLELEVHLDGSVQVTAGEKSAPTATPAPTPAPTPTPQPTAAPTPVPVDDDDDDDDIDDRDDDIHDTDDHDDDADDHADTDTDDDDRDDDDNDADTDDHDGDD